MVVLDNLDRFDGSGSGNIFASYANCHCQERSESKLATASRSVEPPVETYGDPERSEGDVAISGGRGQMPSLSAIVNVLWGGDSCKYKSGVKKNGGPSWQTNNMM